MIPLPAKFSIAFALAGAAISAVFAFLSGNRWEHNVFVVILCTVLSGSLGAVVYAVLRAKVPEFFEIFEGLSGISWSRKDSSASEYPEDELNEYESEKGAEAERQVVSALSGTEANTPPKHFGDHILVDKVKIKNEPRLIAQAIRTMLAKDD
jgi:TctA family transporter